MEDFMDVLNFTIGDLEKQKENLSENPFNINTPDMNAAKDFDFLLDSPSVKNL
jgi:hypothetical protein